MCALFLFEVASGFVLWLVLPSGGQGYLGGRGTATLSTFLGERHVWLDLHNWVAVVLLTMIIWHVARHWKWIVRMTKSWGGQLE
jgi:hypothetical protein